MFVYQDIVPRYILPEHTVVCSPIQTPKKKTQSRGIRPCTYTQKATLISEGGFLLYMVRQPGFEPGTYGLAYHFGFPRLAWLQVCGLDYPFIIFSELLNLDANRLVSTPSHHFWWAWLGIAILLFCSEGFPEFGWFYSWGFPQGTPIEGRCSIQLSYWRIFN